MRPQRILLFLSRLSLTWRFAIAAAGVMAVVFAVSSWVQQRAIVDGTLHDARDDVQLIVAHRVAPRLTAVDLSAPFAGQRLDAFDVFVRDQLLGDDADRVLIVGRQGEILYSSQPDEIGRVLPAGSQRRAAFAGKGTADVASAADQRLSGSDGAPGKALEIYVPLRLSGAGGIDAIVGFYRPYAPLATRINDARRSAALGTAGGLAIVYLLLLGIVHGGGRTIERQRRELAQALVEQDRSDEAVRRQNAYLAALHETTFAVMQRRDLGDVLQTIVGRAAELLDAAHGYAYLLDGGGEAMVMTVATGIFNARVGSRVGYGVGMGGRIWKSGRPVVVENYGAWPGRVPDPLYDSVCASIGVPIVSGGRTVGALSLALDVPDRRFTSAEVAVLSQFAELAALALDNARLFEQAQQELEERRRAEGALAESAATFRLLFAANPHPMWVYDLYTYEFLEVNDAAIARYGYTRDEFLKMRITDMRPADEVHTLLESVGDDVPALEMAGQWRHRAKDGRLFDVEITSHRLEFGRREAALVVAQDVTERKRAERELRFLASHDPLTGLFNRRRFADELEQQLAQARRYGARGALLYIDLDQFKYVNDSLGHHAGDELLVSIARLLRYRLRETDILARLGGDEFAILLPHTDGDEARRLAEDLLDALRRHTVTLGGQTIGITASLGLALYPEHSDSASELLAYADLVMYQVKEQGRNGFGVYAPGDAQAQIAATLSWERRIREALADDCFVLYAQPILDLHSAARPRVSAYELLLRLRSEDGEVVLPGAFLDVAERSGLIRAIDRWVVRQAIGIVAAETAAGRRITLEVNLSGKSITDPELLPLIARELRASGIEPADLIFEITETAAIADIEEARRFIATLKELGCRFAIDDFGVGFSSFYYLKHLPVDYLKIDGSFVSNLPRDLVDQHLVRAIVEVARGLGKQTVAEFVGDDQTVRLLRQFGVDYAQGYHTGRPRPVADLLAAMDEAAA